eukprot:gene14187-19038_t
MVNIYRNVYTILLLTLTIWSLLLICEATKTECRIVIYDKVRGYLNWMQDWFQLSVKEKCNKKCYLTENKKEMSNADIIVFHGPTHTIAGDVLKLPQNNAINVLISMEQPKYAKVMSSTKYLENNFDLLLTYSLSSYYPGTNIPNLPISYYPLHILSPNAVMQAPKPFLQKTGYGKGVYVALFTSNCHNAGASQRYAYIEELMKHIKVNI